MLSPAIRARATTEVSAASGALFRAGFGIVGVVLVVRFFARGWIESLLIEPAYHFSYPDSNGSGPGPSHGCRFTSS